jgi:hypothetical protein
MWKVTSSLKMNRVGKLLFLILAGIYQQNLYYSAKSYGLKPGTFEVFIVPEVNMQDFGGNYLW